MTKPVFDSDKEYGPAIVRSVKHLTREGIYSLLFSKHKGGKSVFLPGKLHDLHTVIANI